MIFEGVRALCLTSVLCGAALSITPEGGTKKVAEILCAAILTIALLSPFKSFSFDDYALQSAKLHEAEQRIISGAEETENRLNRLVIEQECISYIDSKAKELGIEQMSAVMEMRWDLEEIWVPWAVEIEAVCSREQRDSMSEIIGAELGIPEERQRWNEDG